MLLTGEGDDEDDGDVNEEELEVSQVAENLRYQEDEDELSYTAEEKLIYRI